jgi:hypothetical protein
MHFVHRTQLGMHRFQVCRKLEALLWISASGAVGYFGNGKHDTLHILRFHPSIHRPALAVACAMALLNFSIFLYVQLWIRFVRKVSTDPELEVPWAIPVAAGTWVISSVSWVYACWGVWGWMTPAIGVVHLIAFVTMLTNFLPRLGRSKRHAD